METHEDLENIGIGEKEATTLKPARVKIVKASVVSVGDKGNKKVNCEVSHPEKTDGTINISSAKVEKKGKLEVSGLWFNTDEEGKIRKGSTTALFLQFIGANSVRELEGKEVETLEDESGYLTFKSY